MGKRSNFERREADFYPTPRAAVVPLVPYLRRTVALPSPALIGARIGANIALSSVPDLY